ncbi:MAG: gamma-glutamyltransferase [Nannocystaceae bacterium]|nr:gamma-glutamyltransferase [Nannocystaceae bacterium]
MARTAARDRKGCRTPSWRVRGVVAALVAVLGSGCPATTTPADDGTPTQPTVAPPKRSLPDAGSDPAVAVGIHGAVTSAEAAATDVGLAVLRKGGNAVDAAVAVGFALAVTHPSAGNLGGGGFMVLRMADGRTAAIDYRERAPGKATRDMFLDAKGNPTDERLRGPKAAGIPGTVAGLAMAHEQFGTLPWKDLLQPAIALARDGHVVDRWHAEDLARAVAGMKESKLEASAKYYQGEGGASVAEGQRWLQPELATTLQAIADGGARAFYEGPLAQTLAREVAAAGGIWTAADLAEYRAVAREPLQFDYRGHTVITMPPPSAGGVVLRQLLAAAEVLSLHDKPWRSVDEVHLYVESARRTYADRNLLLGDPDFVELPMARLLDVSYIKTRLADVDPLHATPSSSIGAGLPAGKRESEQTTHFSVVDDAGNAVSNTYTLNLGFGSLFVVPGTGVLLNNEMDDFAVKPGTANAFGLVQGEQNAIQPGKRMLSSMTPTILLQDGELRAVLGTPGGPTITTTVSQHVRAIVDYGMTVDAAVASPRIHHQWLPDTIWAEDRIAPELEAGLVARGHVVRKRGSIGHANIIEVDPATKGFRAVADVTRDGGKAAAW